MGYRLPLRRVLLSTGPVEDKAAFLKSTVTLAAAGVEFYGTRGTAAFMADNGLEVTPVYWPMEKSSPNALELIRSGTLDLVINIPKDASEEELTNDYMVRRAAVDGGVPLITNIQLAQRFKGADHKMRNCVGSCLGRRQIGNPGSKSARRTSYE